MKRVTAFTTTAIAAATLLPAAPANAATTNTTFATYSNGTTTSQYHIYANNIDWSKPVGVVFFFDGDYQNPAQTTVNNTNGAALRNIAAVANSHNMVLIPVVSPDKNTSNGSYITWWEEKDTNGAWFRDFARTIITQAGLDASNVWTLGQSGGSEFIGYELSSDSQGSWRSGGGDIMVGGGNSSGLQTPAPAGYNNIPMYWYIGTNDNVTNDNSFGWSAYRAALSGKASYEKAGFTNTNLVMVPNTDHFQYNHAQILDSTLKQANKVTWGTNSPTSITNYTGGTVNSSAGVSVQANNTTPVEEETFDPQAGYDAMTKYYWDNQGEEKFGYATDRPFFSINQGIVQNFEKNTTLYWTKDSGAHTVIFGTGIGNFYADNGFEKELGYPTTDEEKFFDNGALQRFTNATVYWSEATGAHSLVNRGAITNKWVEVGDAEKIGFPTNSEKAAEDGSVSVTFAKDTQKTIILWTEETGAHTLNEEGAIYQAWKANGGAAEHGYPVSDETLGEDGITRVTFADGTVINWTEEHGTWLTVA